MMKKALVLVLVIAIAGFAIVSCAKDVVTYCPFCSKADLKDVSKYSHATLQAETYYECQNPKCGKVFGAGKR